MWNASVPYKLKQLIDVVSQPGLVFSFDPVEGYTGLLTGRKAAVLYTAAIYGPGRTPAFGSDFQAPYLRDWLRWAGIDDITEVEFRPNLATADAETGVEVSAALPDDDLARVDQLAAEALHAKPLRVAVPAVTAGRRALLVCHLCLPSCPYRFFSLVLSLGDAGDPDLGVLLPVTLAALVTRLVPVVDHVDLRTLGRADDLSRHLVAAELRRVADDRAAVHHEQRGERDARPGLLVRKLVDGEHVIEGDLLLPATAAHNRVHPRTASP